MEIADLLTPLAEIVGWLASIEYVLYVVGELITLILSPVFVIINFLGGFLTGLGQNYQVAESGWAMVSSASTTFFLAIPGWTVLVALINACAAWIVIMAIIKQFHHV